MTVRVLYPPLEPHAGGMLAVGDDQDVYWEECGNPQGLPIVVVHGGPGGGCTPDHRRAYDPDRYRIVLFDQRGCGRSRPHASHPAVSLEANTTAHLVADMETLRGRLEIPSWVVSGSSWGSTLALAYSQAHPDRVRGLLLRSVITMRARELDWVYRDGASRLLPDRWEEFVAPVRDADRGDLVSAYRDMLSSSDDAVRRRAARAWVRWELAGMLRHPDPRIERIFDDDDFAMAFARISCHYAAHRGFLGEGQLIREVDRIRHVPAIIVQGRVDLCTPPATAWDLARAWPEAELQLVDAGHTLDEPGVVHRVVDATDRLAALAVGSPSPRSPSSSGPPAGADGRRDSRTSRPSTRS